MYVLRLLCSALATLMAFFRVDLVPSFCARLGPPPPVHLLGAAPSFSPPSSPPLVFAPVCLVPPHLGLSCFAAKSDSCWYASAANTSLPEDLLDSTPTNSLVLWHENSDGKQGASSFALVVLVGVAATLVLQQCFGSGGSRSPPRPFPPLVLPPPPPPYIPQPCSPGSPYLPPALLLQPLPSAIPAPNSSAMERPAVVAAPARRVAGARRKSRRAKRK